MPPADRTTQMRREIAEIPDAVERLLREGGPAVASAAERIRAIDPRVVVTAARGSSDHVCTCLGYAIELLLGLPVASVGPSVASLYGAPLRLDRGLLVAVYEGWGRPEEADRYREPSPGGAGSS